MSSWRERGIRKKMDKKKLKRERMGDGAKVCVCVGGGGGKRERDWETRIVIFLYITTLGIPIINLLIAMVSTSLCSDL